MEILLIEPEKGTRDQIKVGLESFQDIRVEAAEGFAAINRARQKTYDFIVLENRSEVHDGLADLHALREFDHDTPVVLIVTSKQARQLAAERNKLNVYSTLAHPLDVREFFRLVARMRERAAGARS